MLPKEAGKGFFMNKKIYVGNLSYGTNEDSLRDAFAKFGNVETANIVVDRDSGRSKGFGFVEMETEEGASAAISAMNGKELDGRVIKVNEANDKPARKREFHNRW